jgi:hypothetical protein
MASHARTGRWRLPYDIDDSLTTGVLHKRGPNAWAIRSTGWTTGIFMRPPPEDCDDGRTVAPAEVLDWRRRYRRAGG